MGLTVRLGTREDAEVIARHRCEMFTDMGSLAAEEYDRLYAASVTFFGEALDNGNYKAWLALNGETVVAGGGMLINQVAPRPGPGGRMLPSGPQGLIVNVFVEKEWRQRGIAEMLMRSIIEFARTSGMQTVVLHASPEGRALYERLGFAPTSEMRLFLGAPETST